ncbi:MAG: DnaJ domain-containing protein [Dehalococcoidia bacterium]|nr:DnaJ domain-containing protein [Dehalococcoidia bacterium]
MDKDYYRILGIPKTASAGDVKKAYRKLAMQYHPDRNPQKQAWAHAKFKEINEAFAVLGDPERRSQYDRFGTVGEIGDIFASPFTRSTFQDMIKDLGGAGLRFDFLDGLFGNATKGGGSPFSFRRCGRGPGGVIFQTQPGQEINLEDMLGRPRRPQSVRYELAVSQSEASRGVTRVLTRRGKRLEVKIPAGVNTGDVVRLRNARQLSDGLPGDILIKVTVK